MSVLLSRFFMSLLARDSSSTLACNSVLTVWSSSFSDCISSLEVVSSSLVDCSSSLVDCSSSLADRSSSCEVCISSWVVRDSARACWSSCSSSASRGAAGVELCGVRRPALWRSTGAATSVKTIITNPAAAPGSSSRWTVTSTHCLPPLVPTLSPRSDHGFLLPERFLEGAGQFVAQPFAGHGEDVPVGFAGGRFQIFAGPAADIEDVALVIDEHGGRGIMLQDQLIRQGSGDWPAVLVAGRASAPAGSGAAKEEGNSTGSGRNGGLRPPEDPRFAVQRREQIGEVADRLRAAEKQNAAGIQAVVKQRNQFLLHLRRQIDQQVAAAQDIQLGKGRVHDEVLRRKDHHLPDLFAHPVAALFLGEKPAQPLRRNVGGNVVRIRCPGGPCRSRPCPDRWRRSAA